MNAMFEKLAQQVFDSNPDVNAVALYGGTACPVYAGTIERPAPASPRRLFTAEDRRWFWSPQERAVRLLDMKRAQQRLAYMAACEEFVGEQPIGIGLAGAFGGPALERAADARVQTVVDYVAALLRLRLEQDWTGRRLDETARLFIPIDVQRHLQDLLARHPDILVQNIAEFGQWRVHFMPGDIAITFGGMPEGL